MCNQPSTASILEHYQTNHPASFLTFAIAGVATVYLFDTGRKRAPYTCPFDGCSCLGEAKTRNALQSRLVQHHAPALRKAALLPQPFAAFVMNERLGALDFGRDHDDEAMGAEPGMSCLLPARDDGLADACFISSDASHQTLSFSPSPLISLEPIGAHLSSSRDCAKLIVPCFAGRPR